MNDPNARANALIAGEVDGSWMAPLDAAEKLSSSDKGDLLFGLNTLPEYRKNGYAGELLHRAVEDARKQGRKGAVLTCKQRLVDYYAKFCFVDEGVTDKSVHGGVVWHQMRITF